VIGLYAATPVARSGPYRSLDWCVDVHESAAAQFLGKPAQALRWTRKIEQDGVMDLVSVDQAIARLDRLMAAPRAKAA
jgi:heptosyltransferase I